MDFPSSARVALGQRARCRLGDTSGLSAALFVAITGHTPYERHSGEWGMTPFFRIVTGRAPIGRSTWSTTGVG
ncbi:hypothetical protein P3H15_50640 [Rhodococcus sp. T2V]|nr:hypothetical protein [Rhodococcus sp. T2V]